MAKVKIGYMKCEGRRCINGGGGPGRVVVWQNDKGTLNYRCDECGRSPYAVKGSEIEKEWREEITPASGGGDPKSEPKPAGDPAPAPAKKSRYLVD